MPKTRFIIVGGFLGMGKTTAMLQLAAELRRRGFRPGLITNDQSTDLVDTARAAAAGFAVREITGGCFCCRFESLVHLGDDFRAAAAHPDVLIAEPVGSCTDLRATVGYPMCDECSDRYLLSPFSVLVDPALCRELLTPPPAPRFSPNILYIAAKQLEEADIILLNKSDLLSPADCGQLLHLLQLRFPAATIRAISCTTGVGLPEWFDLLLARQIEPRPTMEVDYDRYADGEARLGWINIRARITAPAPFDANVALLDLASHIRNQLHVPIAHLKLTLAAPDGLDLAAVGLVDPTNAPVLTHCFPRPLPPAEAARLLINLRAEADAALLKPLLLQLLSNLPQFTLTIEHIAAFQPGRPEPQRRVVLPVLNAAKSFDSGLG
jgi:G3E family GTPase